MAEILKRITCPFTGGKLASVPAIRNPDDNPKAVTRDGIRWLPGDAVFGRRSGT